MNLKYIKDSQFSYWNEKLEKDRELMVYEERFRIEGEITIRNNCLVLRK